MLGDWHNSYITSHSQYVARQLRLFDRLRVKGLIYRVSSLNPIFSKKIVHLFAIDINQLYHCSNIKTSLQMLYNYQKICCMFMCRPTCLCFFHHHQAAPWLNLSLSTMRTMSVLPLPLP